MIRHVFSGRECAVTRKDVDYELYHVSLDASMCLCQTLLAETGIARDTYSLCDIQSNDTLECEELKEDPMLEQFGLILAVKPQAA